MRFRHLLLLPTLALTLVPIAFGGCNQDEELDNLCLFLKDKQSCYQQFLTDLGTQCTMNAVTGTFDSYDNLEKCTVTTTGAPADAVTIVQFDPPIELTKLPYTAGNIKLLINGTQCGTIDFGENDKLSVALDVYPPLTDPAAACENSGTQFCGTSYSNTPITGDGTNGSTSLVNTKCPDGTTFKFDQFQVAQQCSDQAGLIPTVKLAVVPSGVQNADGTGTKGSVKLVIQYTPDNIQTYVNCEILPSLPACANGVQDGVETDKDCGGGVCDKCGDQQNCISNSDCGSNICMVTAGIKKCVGNAP